MKMFKSVIFSLLVSSSIFFLSLNSFSADGDRVVEGVTADKITTVALDVTGITDGYIPYLGALGFLDSPLSTDGTDVELGADDVTKHLDIHSAGTIKIRDDSDDTLVTIGPVTDGTTILGITGTLNPTALQESGNAVPNDTDNLSFFAATTSAQLAGVLSDETGSGGGFVRATSPTIATPIITSIVPGANFSLTQNSVAAFTSEESGALANTLYLKAGKVGINNAAPTNRLHINSNAIGVTQLDTYGLRIANSTAAAAGAQQYSPPLVQRGSGWKTDATAASQKVEFMQDVRPVQGASAPTGYWGIYPSINDAAYSATPALTVTSAGNVGIGTTGPGASFTVSGLEGLAGTINLWADDGDDAADKFVWSMSAAGVLTETIGGTTTRTVAADGSVDFPLDVTVQSLTADPSSAPGINFIDSDGADLDVSGKIYNNLTATGSGAEVGDFYFQVMGAQGTAGTLATAFYWKGSDRNLILYGSVIPGQETITCASDVCTENIKLQTHFIVSEGGAEVDADLLTLDNGTTTGQEVTFIFKTESDAGDTIVIDTAQQVGWSDFTMAEVGDSVTFVWDGTNWTIKAYYQAGTY